MSEPNIFDLKEEFFGDLGQVLEFIKPLEKFQNI